MRNKLHTGTLFASMMMSLALQGCGSSDSSSSFSGPASGDGRVLRVLVPPSGGTISLPDTQGVSGSLKFAPGAAADTLLTLTVSENPPSQVADIITHAPGTVTDGFHYLSLTSSQPFDVQLIEELNLREGGHGISARADGGVDSIPDEAEHFRGELVDITGGGSRFIHEVPGTANADKSSAQFSQFTRAIVSPGQVFLLAARATDVETLPTTVVNNSGIEPVNFNILGQNPNPLGGVVDPLYYRVSADGQLVAFAKTDRNIDIQSNNQGGFNGYTDKYNIPVTGGSRTFNLPQMRAGRMYIAVGNKMRIRLEDNAAPNPQPPVLLAQPNGWANPGDPNFKILYDFVEFDYKVNVDTGTAGLGINKTEVDMLGFGIQIQLEGPTLGSATVGTKEGGRKSTFDTLLADPIFRTLVIPGPARGELADGTPFDLPADIPIRVVSPKKGLDNVINNIAPGQVPTFDTTYFDAYIDKVWTKYKSEDLSAFTSAFGRYTARVDDQDRLVFTRVDDGGTPRPGFQKIFLRKPKTSEAFEPTDWITSGGITFEPTPGATPIRVPDPPPGVPAPKEGDDPALFTPYAASEIVSAISAAFNRTTLTHDNFITRDYVNHPHNKLNFYRTDGGDRINVYAKTIHDDSLTTTDAPGPPTSNGGGAAYAFGFDDNSNQSSFLSENKSPTKLVITITKLTP